jgi:sec-independent protein translocase protein TatA
MYSDGRDDPVGNPGSGSCTISGGRQRRANWSDIGGRRLVFTGLESPTHLIIVLAIVLLLFGSKRIPELAKGLGAGLHEFRKGAQGEVDEDTDAREDDSGTR